LVVDDHHRPAVAARRVLRGLGQQQRRLTRRRQPHHREGGAGARLRRDIDGAAEVGDDVVHERQPQPGTLPRRRQRRLARGK
jgi:hypothetical protein